VSDIIGVDFGTSTSLLAVSSVRGAQTLPIGQKYKWIPSIAGLEGASWAVGDDASDFDEPSIIRSIKRTITEGRELVSVSDGTRKTIVKADDVIRDILREIVERAAYNAISVSDQTATVRLGCPAMWTGAQRKRLITLANDAGVAVRDATLVDEPIAAGVAWVNSQLAKGVAINGKVLVYDMGGGTLDIAILRVRASAGTAGRRADIAVQAANGNQIAGDLVDAYLVEILKTRLAEAGFDADGPGYGTELHGWLLRAAREAKVELSTLQETTVVVPHPRIDIPAVRMLREDVDTAVEPLVKQSMDRVWEVARAALMSQVAGSTESDTLKPSQARALSGDDLAIGINYVVLAGGMSRVPAISNALGDVFGHDRIYRDTEPEELIVRGLGADEAYESLNLHRPGFDFVLEWTDDLGESHERAIYEAYTPFYNAHQVLNTDSVKYLKRLPSLPSRGKGLVRARSVSGDTVPLTIDGTEVDGIPFEFGPDTNPHMSIEPNGRVFLRDAFGRQSEWYIARWPVIKGRGTEAVHITRTREAAEQREWFYDRSGD
jgi:molecular chaperone DnaK (HSP70)